MILDFNTGKELERIHIPGAEALSGISVAKDGTIFTADEKNGAILSVSQGQVNSLVQTKTNPKKMILDGSKITFTTTPQLDIQTKGGSGFFSFDLRTQQVTESFLSPLVGQLVGIEDLGKNKLLLTDVRKGTVVKYSKQQRSLSTIVTNTIAHDVTLISDANAFLVALPNENRVEAYELP